MRGWGQSRADLCSSHWCPEISVSAPCGAPLVGQGARLQLHQPHGAVQPSSSSSSQTREGAETRCTSPGVCKALIPVAKSGDGEGEGISLLDFTFFCLIPHAVVTFLSFPACSLNTGCTPCLCLLAFNPRDGSVTDPHCNFLNQSPLSRIEQGRGKHLKASAAFSISA